MDIDERFHKLIELTVFTALLTDVPLGSRYAAFFRVSVEKQQSDSRKIEESTIRLKNENL